MTIVIYNRYIFKVQASLMTIVIYDRYIFIVRASLMMIIIYDCYIFIVRASLMTIVIYDCYIFIVQASLMMIIIYDRYIFYSTGITYDDRHLRSLYFYSTCITLTIVIYDCNIFIVQASLMMIVICDHYIFYSTGITYDDHHLRSLYF